MTNRSTHTDGFTLIEIVMVIALVAILGAMSASFIRWPMESYRDTVVRADLVESANLALRRIVRDVTVALPNSLRVANAAPRHSLEVLHTIDGGRYRRGTSAVVNDPDQFLSFGMADDSFNLLGTFSAIAPGAQPAGTRIAIYTTDNDALYADAVAADATFPADTSGVVTSSAGTVTLADDATTPTTETRISLVPAHTFAEASPEQRLFVVDYSLSYQCDTTTGVLTRYQAYAVTAAQPQNPAAAPLNAAARTSVMATNLSACEFVYEQGSTERSGLLTIVLQVASSGDSVRLMRQVHVDNTP